MPFTRRTNSLPPRRMTRAGLVVLLIAGLTLAACGRKGAPEFDSGEPVVRADTTKNELIPGLNLPQKQATQPKAKKPKGDFVLDPLL